jgi:hypothetical protein
LRGAFEPALMLDLALDGPLTDCVKLRLLAGFNLLYAGGGLRLNGFKAAGMGAFALFTRCSVDSGLNTSVQCFADSPSGITRSRNARIQGIGQLARDLLARAIYFVGSEFDLDDDWLSHRLDNR